MRGVAGDPGSASGAGLSFCPGLASVTVIPAKTGIQVFSNFPASTFGVDDLADELFLKAQASEVRRWGLLQEASPYQVLLFALLLSYPVFINRNSPPVSGGGRAANLSAVTRFLPGACTCLSSSSPSPVPTSMPSDWTDNIVPSRAASGSGFRVPNLDLFPAMRCIASRPGVHCPNHPVQDICRH